MDDALIARWKTGDTTATTAVRNGLRTVAERVLCHPAVSQSTSFAAQELGRDEKRRREITAEIARDVMQRGGNNASQVLATALMMSSRRVIDVMRSGRPAFGGEGHVPPQLAVTLALAPQGIPEPQRKAAEAHLESCTACAEDLRVVSAVIKSRPDVSPVAPISSDVDAPPRPERPLFEGVPEDLLRELEAEADRPPEPAPQRQREAAAKTQKREAAVPDFKRDRSRGAEREEGRTFLTPFLWLGLIVGGVWWWSARETPVTDAVMLTALSGLAEKAEPTAYPKAVDQYAQLAVSIQGGCARGGDKARYHYATNPRDYSLGGYAAAALVCAGQGDEALEVLRRMEDERGFLTPDEAWLMAQAYLLVGDAKGASSTLTVVIAERTGLAPKAESQLRTLKALMGS